MNFTQILGLNIPTTIVEKNPAMDTQNKYTRVEGDGPGFPKSSLYVTPGIPTTIKTMGSNIPTIVYLRVFIIEIGSTIILMVVEAQGHCMLYQYIKGKCHLLQHTRLPFLIKLSSHEPRKINPYYYPLIMVVQEGSSDWFSTVSSQFNWVI